VILHIEEDAVNKVDAEAEEESCICP